jgi:hypothetical protein
MVSARAFSLSIDHLFSLSLSLSIPSALCRDRNYFVCSRLTFSASLFQLIMPLCAVLWVWLGYVLFPFYQKRTTTPWKAAFISLTLIFLFLLPVPDLNMADKFYGSVFLNIGFALLIISTMILFLKDLRVSLARDWSQETMLLFVFHPYTNNAAHILVEKINPTLWGVKLLLSLVF